MAEAGDIVLAGDFRVRDGSSLNARAGPGTGFDRTGSLAPGTRLVEFERSGDWSKVETPDGAVVWVHNGYIVKAEGDDARLKRPADGVRPQLQVGHSAQVADVQLSNDGRYMVTRDVNDSVKLWDRQTGVLLRDLSGDSEDLTVLLSPDGSMIHVRPDKVRFYTIGGKPVEALAGIRGSMPPNAFSRDGSTVAMETEDGVIEILDARTGEPLRRFEDDRKLDVLGDGRLRRVPFDFFAISPDHTSIALSGLFVGSRLLGGDFRVISDDIGFGSKFSPTGKWVVAGTTIRDAETGRKVLYIPMPEDDGGYTVSIGRRVWSPDDSRLAISYDGARPPEIWDVGAGTKTALDIDRQPNMKCSNSSGFEDITAFTADGGHVITDNRLMVWDARTGRPAGQLSHDWASQPVWTDCVKPWATTVRGTGEILAFANDGSIHSFSAGDWSHQGAMGLSMPAALHVAWDTDGRHLNTFLSREVLVPQDKAKAPRKNFAFRWDADYGQFAGDVSKTGIAKAADPDGNRGRRHRRSNSAMWIPGSSSPGRDDIAAVSHDRTLALFGTETGMPQIGDRLSGQVRQKLELPDPGWERKYWPTGPSDAELEGVPGAVHPEEAAWSPDGRFLAWTGRDGLGIIWNTATGKVAGRLEGHSNPIYSITWSPDGRRLATASRDGTVRVWSRETQAELVRLINFPDGEWIAITPDGFFNASPGGAERVRVVKGNEVVSVENFFDSLYRPDLVREALAGDPAGTVAAAAAELGLEQIWRSGLPPVITSLQAPDGTVTAEDRITVRLTLQPADGGIGRVVLKINGATQVVEGVPAGDGEAITIAQEVFLTPGRNQLEATAFNEANLIASAPARIEVESTAEPAKATLHILSIGVDRYADERLNLNYAVGDSVAIASALETIGEASDQFSDVKVVRLSDGDVTGDRIESAIGEIAATARPEDVFVLFLAGHGKTVDGRYHFLPHDFTYNGPESFASAGIGQNTWQAWLARIPAQRSMLLYDTCESGSLTESEIDALALDAATTRLARATGRTVLTAATETEPALEGYGGHGVFTYTVLEALGLGDRDKDGQIEVGELAGYVEAELPRLSYRAFGHRQVPQASVKGLPFTLGTPKIVLSD